MNILDKYVAFVKENMIFHERRSHEFETNSPSRSKRHQQTADTFKELLGDIEKLSLDLNSAKQQEPVTASDANSPQSPKQLRLSLTEEDVKGLPPELINELNLSAGDRAEFAILNILEESNGVTSLDRLLIGLYRKTGEIHKRDKLQSRLYRMMQKNLIYSVPGKKGVYSLEPIGTDTGVDASIQEAI